MLNLIESSSDYFDQQQVIRLWACKTFAAALTLKLASLCSTGAQEILHPLGKSLVSLFPFFLTTYLGYHECTHLLDSNVYECER